MTDMDGHIQNKPKGGDPFCGNCKYPLSGLVDSSKCPECGKPLVEVLQRGPYERGGKRYQSPVRIFGLPLLSIAIGPYENEKRGDARGIVAIGDTAVGWFALGGRARGIIAIGGLATGVLAIGGLSIGFFSFGGWAMGLVAVGGGAAGGFASGGMAIGGLAQGGMAIGYYAQGGGVGGKFVHSPTRSDPEAIAAFEGVNSFLLLGQSAARVRGNVLMIYVIAMVWIFLITISLAAPLLVVGYFEYRRQTRRQVMR
ncbi:MAG: hypothetical protein AB7N71_03035 [Phycisphaerae bacterium]